MTKTTIEKQNKTSHDNLLGGATWFEALADIHKNNLAKRELFNEIAKALRHYDDKLGRELARLEGAQAHD